MPVLTMECDGLCERDAGVGVCYALVSSTGCTVELDWPDYPPGTQPASYGYPRERFYMARVSCLSLADRFWNKVKRCEHGACRECCWEYQGSRNKKGYGKFSVRRGAWEIASRVAWQLIYGPLAGSVCVLHKCDNPPCCNPLHLFIGTIADNNSDMRAKGHSAVGDRNGARRFPERLPRGDEHHQAKITYVIADAIRIAYDNGSASMHTLARKYGVSVSQVWNVIHHKTWVRMP